MWLQKTFNLEYPVLQGGMAHISTAAFAAAVSNAGAMGQIGSGAMTASQVRDAICQARSLTDKPFGVNVMLMNPDVDEIAEIIAEERVPLVTTGAGNPGRFISMWKEAGCVVIPVVSSLSLAIRMQRTGADAVIAEGQEAGGHIGEMTSLVLWPLLSENLDIPVIAAGGLAKGSQLLAARLLGAEGFQIGTLFLATEECPIHEHYKDAVIQARDSQIGVIGRFNGLPCRVLKNSLARQAIELEKHESDKMILEQKLAGSLRRAVFDGDKVDGGFMMGLSASLINEIMPIRQRLEKLFEEMEAAKAHCIEEMS